MKPKKINIKDEIGPKRDQRLSEIILEKISIEIEVSKAEMYDNLKLINIKDIEQSPLNEAPNEE